MSMPNCPSVLSTYINSHEHAQLSVCAKSVVNILLVARTKLAGKILKVIAPYFILRTD